MVNFREKLVAAALIFLFLNIIIFTALFQFSDEFRASGTVFAGMVLGNLVVVIGGLAGFAAAGRDNDKNGGGQ